MNTKTAALKKEASSLSTLLDQLAKCASYLPDPEQQTLKKQAMSVDTENRFLAIMKGIFNDTKKK